MKAGLASFVPLPLAGAYALTQPRASVSGAKIGIKGFGDFFHLWFSSWVLVLDVLGIGWCKLKRKGRREYVSIPLFDSVGEVGRKKI